PPLPDPMPYEVALPEAPVTEATAEVEAPEEAVAEAPMPTEAPSPGPEVAAAGTIPLSAPATGQRGNVGSRATTMQPTPHPALIEQGRHGLLPVVAPDGRQSWQVYARPFDDSDERPQIALVVIGLGVGNAGTNKAVRMPGEVTLAFSPYGESSDTYVREARAGGHEVLLEVPMEPLSFPTDDPGPRALMTSLGPRQNLERLTWLMSRFAGYVGIIESYGGRFTDSEIHLEPMMFEIGRRGLLYVDRANTVSDVPRAIADKLGMLHIATNIDLDIEPSRAEIRKRMAAADMMAKQQGTAVVIARSYPVTLDLLEVWINGLERDGIALAPLTAVLARRAQAAAQ
ncbi:MAG: divergent polysaccharide deacetylase family protein, partial [Alphaproteobacteria bacterium]|nr:divergent polysaccharide deacetylase family protein [Alphaproteobacteria bacterium]